MHQHAVRRIGCLVRSTALRVSPRFSSQQHAATHNLRRKVGVVALTSFGVAAFALFPDTSATDTHDNNSNNKPLSLQAVRRLIERGIDDLQTYSPISYRSHNSDASVVFSSLPLPQAEPNAVDFTLRIAREFYPDLVADHMSSKGSDLCFFSPSANLTIRVSTNASNQTFTLALSRVGGLRGTDADCALKLFRLAHGAQPSSAKSGSSSSSLLRAGKDWLLGGNSNSKSNDNEDNAKDEQSNSPRVVFPPRTGNVDELEDMFDQFSRELERAVRGLEGMQRPIPEGTDENVGKDAVEPNNPINELERMGARVFRAEEHAGISWDNLAAAEFVRHEVEDAVLLPMKHQEIYDEIAKATRKRFESNFPRAVLFSGPPGTGKTTVARIIASQTETTLVYVPAEAIVSKWYGEGEQRLAKLLAECRKLETGAIVFVDEIDALAQDRGSNMHEATRRLLSVLLRNVDGFESEGRVVLLGATNRPSDLDKALLSRFDVHVHFGLPPEVARGEIFKNYAKHLGNKDIQKLANASEGMAGRDIRDICSAAERHWAGKRARNETKVKLPPLEAYLESLHTKITSKS